METKAALHRYQNNLSKYLFAETLLFNLVITAHSKPNLCTPENILSYNTIPVSKNDDDDHLKC